MDFHTYDQVVSVLLDVAFWTAILLIAGTTFAWLVDRHRSRCPRVVMRAPQQGHCWRVLPPYERGTVYDWELED
jgi:hypothetical protein